MPNGDGCAGFATQIIRGIVMIGLFVAAFMTINWLMHLFAIMK